MIKVDGNSGLQTASTLDRGADAHKLRKTYGEKRLLFEVIQGKLSCFHRDGLIPFSGIPANIAGGWDAAKFKAVMANHFPILRYSVHNPDDISSVHMFPKGLGGFQIFVLLPSSKTITIDIDKDDTIHELKSKIQDKESYDIERQIIICRLKILKDQECVQNYVLVEQQVRLVVKSPSTNTPIPTSVGFQNVSKKLAYAHFNRYPSNGIKMCIYLSPPNTDRKEKVVVNRGISIVELKEFAIDNTKFLKRETIDSLKLSFNGKELSEGETLESIGVKDKGIIIVDFKTDKKHVLNEEVHTLGQTFSSNQNWQSWISSAQFTPTEEDVDMLGARSSEGLTNHPVPDRSNMSKTLPEIVSENLNHSMQSETQEKFIGQESTGEKLIASTLGNLPKITASQNAHIDSENLQSPNVKTACLGLESALNDQNFGLLSSPERAIPTEENMTRSSWTEKLFPPVDIQEGDSCPGSQTEVFSDTSCLTTAKSSGVLLHAQANTEGSNSQILHSNLNEPECENKGSVFSHFLTYITRIFSNLLLRIQGFLRIS